jgi:hypothetical protein
MPAVSGVQTTKKVKPILQLGPVPTTGMIWCPAHGSAKHITLIGDTCVVGVSFHPPERWSEPHRTIRHSVASASVAQQCGMVPYFAPGLHSHNNSRPTGQLPSAIEPCALSWGHSRVSAARMDGRNQTPLVLTFAAPRLVGKPIALHVAADSNVCSHPTVGLRQPLGSAQTGRRPHTSNSNGSMRRTWKVDGIRVVALSSSFRAVDQVQVQVCFTSVDGQVQPLDVA